MTFGFHGPAGVGFVFVEFMTFGFGSERGFINSIVFYETPVSNMGIDIYVSKASVPEIFFWHLGPFREFLGISIVYIFVENIVLKFCEIV